MNSQWQTFLEQHGAHIEDGRVLHFGDPANELHQVDSGPLLCDLSHSGLIDVYGTDAATFMQGQFCNDVRAVTAQRSQLSGYCNPKGRLLATFRLFLHGDHYYLSVPNALHDTVLKRLRMYVLRAKVTLATTDNRGGIGLAGIGVEQLVQTTLGTVPTDIDAVLTANGCAIVRVAGPLPRFEIHGDYAALRALWSELATHASAVGAEVWSLLDIRSGLATVYPQTSEAFVPQMINLQQVGGVSFSKGCYPGQEVVARMHYLGKLKRRMYRAHVTGAAAPQPGDALFTTAQEAGQDTGMVVAAAAASQGGYEVLAVIQSAAVQHGDVRLGSATGVPLQFLELPYALDAGGVQQI